jgi:hypothetical protein
MSTLVTLMFFAFGVWAVGTGLLTTDDRLGLAFSVALDAADATAAVLATAALTGTAGFGVALALAVVLPAALATKTFAFGSAALAFAGVVLTFAAVLTAALAITALALATGAVAFLATAALPRGFAIVEVFTSCLLAVSKGRVLTDCPCAADRKPVHVLFKPLLWTFWGSPASPKGVAVGGRL